MIDYILTKFLTPKKKSKDQLTDKEIDANELKRMDFLIHKLRDESKLDSVKVVRASKNYFDLSLEERMDLLGAKSTEHLCKTIIM